MSILETKPAMDAIVAPAVRPDPHAATGSWALAALFDLDGVLAQFESASAAAFFGRLLPISLAELGRQWEGWLSAQGEILGQAPLWPRFWTEVSERFRLAPGEREELIGLDYRRFYRAYSDGQAALSAARSLGLRTGILSNTPVADLPALLQSLDLLDLVDVVLFPQSTGAAKPAPAAYRQALAALDVNADQCLFFDDEPANVAGAAAVGIRSYRVDRRVPGGRPLAPGVLRDLTGVPAIIEDTTGQLP
jgi:HAD superfamily hydrolase (TIGR01509 family)